VAIGVGVGGWCSASSASAVAAANTATYGKRSVNYRYAINNGIDSGDDDYDLS
jgi:hypothetical protein